MRDEHTNCHFTRVGFSRGILNWFVVNKYQCHSLTEEVILNFAYYSAIQLLLPIPVCMQFNR